MARYRVSKSHKGKKIVTLLFWSLVLNLFAQNHICQVLHHMLLTTGPSHRIPRRGGPNIFCLSTVHATGPREAASGPNPAVSRCALRLLLAALQCTGSAVRSGR